MAKAKGKMLVMSLTICDADPEGPHVNTQGFLDVEEGRAVTALDWYKLFHFQVDKANRLWTEELAAQNHKER